MQSSTTLRILLPLDGTPLSLDQTRFAIRLAEGGLRAHFVVANVQEPASFYEVITAHDPTRLEEMVIGTGKELVAPGARLLVEAGLPHDVVLAQEGDPVQGMLELIESERCDMVIIGAHDHSLFESGRLRSSAERLLKVSPVPVLSVRAPTAPDPDLEAADTQSGQR